MKKKTHSKRSKKSLREYEWLRVLTVPILVVGSFFTASVAVSLGLVLLRSVLGSDLSKFGSPAVQEAAAAAFVYVIAIALVMAIPYVVKRRTTSLSTLGLQRLMSWSDIGLAPLAFIAYAVLSWGVLALIIGLIPGFPADQTQDTGFNNLTNQIGMLVAFITLVVLAPIAEETLFRGYLYGKLRGRVPLWATILTTSLVFGAVHWQWNVSVDTFALSLVLCGLRELTGSIWAGILLHMLKNMLAFYLLFISPLIGLGTGA